jgi:hypothetical protein
MAKKRDKRDPSDCVHDTFRRRNAGVVDVMMNDKDATRNFYVDRSRLETVPRFEDGPGFKMVEEPVNIIRKSRREMGGLKFSSSNKRG